MITYVIQRGNAGFFWSRFHAAFYDTLIINVSKNKAWLRPAEWLFNRWTGQSNAQKRTAKSCFLISL